MKYLTRILLIVAPVIFMAGCTKDPDKTPIVGAVANTVYTTPTAYLQGLAKIYGGFALTGQQGPAGNGDVAGIDEGTSDYIRGYWQMQELPTEEAVCHWYNVGPFEIYYHLFSWTSSNTNILQGMYDRIYFEVAVANEYIRQSSDAVINSKGFASGDVANIKNYRNESRFLRALTYYHAIDLYGNIPLIKETDLPGAFLPKQVTRDSMFRYVESELLELSNNNLLPAPGQNQYGRVDEAAVWTLLAKLYLNAKVYTGTDRSTDCITYCNKVINSGVYAVSTTNPYGNIFRPDSHATSSAEIIFPVRMDGASTQSFGSTNFIIHAAVGGTMPVDSFGVNGGWAGLTTTSTMVNLFDMANDKRAMFWTDGLSKEINAIVPNDFTYGYGVTKFKNVSSTGVRPYPALDYVSTDYPMFRTSDVYLMYAESVLRGGTGGDMTTAVSLFNKIREKAYGNTSGDFSTITLNDIINERGRELYWEATRRTDLIRFGLFTSSSYLWPWKGGNANGTGVDSHFNLYPIPTAEITANPTIVQNPGYTN